MKTKRGAGLSPCWQRRSFFDKMRNAPDFVTEMRRVQTPFFFGCANKTERCLRDQPMPDVVMRNQIIWRDARPIQPPTNLTPQNAQSLSQPIGRLKFGLRRRGFSIMNRHDDRRVAMPQKCPQIAKTMRVGSPNCFSKLKMHDIGGG